MSRPYLSLGRVVQPAQLATLNGQYARMAATAVTFVLSIHGFHLAYESVPGADQRLVSHIVRAFNLAIGEFPGDLENRALPVTLVIARYLLPALSWWTALYGIWLAVRNDVRLALVRRRGGHLVVAGDNGLAARLATGERKQHRRVVILTRDARSLWVVDAANQGAPHVSLESKRYPSRAVVRKARLIAAVGDDDAENVELARKLLQDAARRPRELAPLQILTRVDDPDLREQLDRRLQRLSQGVSVRLRTVSLPDVEARRLFLEHPLDYVVRADDPLPRVYLLGFSATAERYLFRLLAGAHFRGGGRPRIMVLDPEAARAREVFVARYPAASAMDHLRFEEVPIHNPALVAGIMARLVRTHGPPSLAIVDPDPAAAAFPVALAMEEFFVAAAIAAPRIVFRSEANPAADISATLHAFGVAQVNARPETFLQEEHDALARSIHESYLERRLAEPVRNPDAASLRPWDELPEAVRDDNRLVADLYELKLRDIGARIIAGQGPSLELAPDEIEELAEAEHLRWMSLKLLQGWVPGDVRDDAGRVHPDLMPYAALSERVKDLDREQVRLIATLLGRAGKRAVRDVIVDAAEFGDAAAVPALLAQVEASRPAARAVLTGRLDRAAERDALVAAQARGYPVRAVVSGNVDALADALSGDAAAAARAMLRGADRVLISAPSELSR